MAIALVTQIAAGASAGTSPVTTSSVNSTGSSGIVVSVSGSNQGVITISDSNSNTYTRIIDAIATLATEKLSFFYCKLPVVGAGHTFTATNTSSPGSFMALTVFCFSGTDQTTFYDGTVTNASVSGTTLQPGSITPTKNNCILVSGFLLSSAGTPTINGGFSSPFGNPFAGGISFGSFQSYLVQTTPAPANPTWTSVGSSINIAVMAAFRPVNFVPQVGAFIVGI